MQFRFIVYVNLLSLWLSVSVTYCQTTASITIENKISFESYWEWDTGDVILKDDFDHPSDPNVSLPIDGSSDFWYLKPINLNSFYTFRVQFDVEGTLCDMSEVSVRVKYFSYLAAVNIAYVNSGAYEPLPVSSGNQQWSTVKVEVDLSDNIEIYGTVLHPSGYFVFDSIVVEHNGCEIGTGSCTCQVTTTTDTTDPGKTTNPGSSTPESETSTVDYISSTIDSGSSTIDSGSSTVDSVISTAEPETTTVDYGSSTFDYGSSTVDSGSSTAEPETSTVDSGSSTVDSVSSTVDSVSSTVDSVSSTVDSGSSTVDSVSSTVDSGSSTVDSGSSTVDSGSSTVDSGSSTVDFGSSTAKPEPTTVDYGSSTFESGSSTADSGSSTVDTGSSPIAPGSSTAESSTSDSEISITNSPTTPTSPVDTEPSSGNVSSGTTRYSTSTLLPTTTLHTIHPDDNVGGFGTTELLLYIILPSVLVLIVLAWGCAFAACRKKHLHSSRNYRRNADYSRRTALQQHTTKVFHINESVQPPPHAPQFNSIPHNADFQFGNPRANLNQHYFSNDPVRSRTINRNTIHF